MQETKESSDSKPSDELLFILKVVNFIPYAIELEGNRSELIKLTSEYDELKKYIRSFSKDLYSKNALSGFRVFVILREFMKVIVDISEEYRNYLEQTEKNNKLTARKFSVSPHDSPNELGLRLVTFTMWFLRLTTDESHHIKIEWDSLAETIQNQDLRRFKKCVVCNKFIWATRLNKKYCSNKCSNLYHQRLFQSDEKKHQEFKEKRRLANKARKTLKEAKERRKKNGTL